MATKSTWVKNFLDWLKKIFRGGSESARSVSILEEYHSDRVSLFRLKNDSIPGCIDFWKIDHHHEQISFWICILSISELRSALASLGTSPADFLRNHHRGLATNIETQLTTQDQYLATHYWIVGLTKSYQGVDAKGRHFKTFRSSDVSLLAVDLQGAAASFAGNKYAYRFAREVAKRVANCEFREYKNHRDWASAVKSIDWLQWLEGLAQGTKGIDPTHRLQVLKAKKLRGKGNA